MAQLNVTELDFADIKQSLKNYLEAQSEFSDYDFEGSAMSVLLDALAYNTHYNAMLAHMQANEGFLDTAIKRNSVVSHAKALGYTPRSVRGSTAVINLAITGSILPASVTSLTLSRDVIFTSVIGQKNYYFYPRNTVTVNKETRDGVGGFYFDNLSVTEGTRVENRFLVDSTNVSGPFVIPNKNVDTTTIRVRVQDSATNLTLSTYKNYTNITDVSTTTKAFFIEEDIDGLYIIRFGDDYIGKKLEAGNVVIIDYINSTGEAANFGSSFSVTETFVTSGESVSVTVVSNSSGGQDRETIDSIRQSAPRYNQTRNRAVTSADYEALIKASNTHIQSVSVWGGEDNIPPIYGKVFISLDPVEGATITQNDKDAIQTEIIAPKAPLGILAEFVDPIRTYIQLKIGVVYNPKSTPLTQGGIQAVVTTAVNNYFTNELNVLNKNFYLSRLYNYVKAASNSIISININPKLQKRFTPRTLTVAESFQMEFHNKLEPRTLHSTWFNATVETATIKCKLVDIPDTGVNPPEYNGNGKIYLQNETGENLSLVGTVNYDTGLINFTATIASYVGPDTFIRVNFKPHDDVKDIKTNVLTRVSAPDGSSAVVAYPSKNTVLTRDDTVLNTLTGARKGLEIIVSQYTEDD